VRWRRLHRPSALPGCVQVERPQMDDETKDIHITAIVRAAAALRASACLTDKYLRVSRPAVTSGRRSTTSSTLMSVAHAADSTAAMLTAACAGCDQEDRRGRVEGGASRDRTAQTESVRAACRLPESRRLTAAGDDRFEKKLFTLVEQLEETAK
jgi:hypothetical protein